VWNRTWRLPQELNLLPIVLERTAISVGLAGRGEAMERRRQWLMDAGVVPIDVAFDGDGPLPEMNLLFVAGTTAKETEPLARRARASGALVNVEDVTALCDFHVPAIVRRGDLVISVSTGGRAPGLAKLLREWLSGRFGPEWSRYLDQASDARATWRAEGASAPELSRRTRALAAAQQWLP
jgi:precorrin-2 dehydrogenase/sirohydrochlorin ferrochelatase